MRYTVSKSIVSVLGAIWQPGFGACAMDYTLDAFALIMVREYKEGFGLNWREAVSHWLALNAGDFSSFTDFSASLEIDGETVEIPWADEDNEMVYLDAMYGKEDS